MKDKDAKVLEEAYKQLNEFEDSRDIMEITIYDRSGRTVRQARLDVFGGIKYIIDKSHNLGDYEIVIKFEGAESSPLTGA